MLVVGGLVPWEKVAIQLEPRERIAFESAFAGARGTYEPCYLGIWGRKYLIPPHPSTKVWLVIESVMPSLGAASQP